jgi:hypothetical protein
MAKSISQIQNELVNDGTINAIVKELERKGDAEITELTFVQDAIIQFALAFIEKVKENITNSNAIDTGGLIDGISSGELTRKESKYELQVGYDPSSPASKYYDYVNKGVQGFISKQPNSPYKYQSAFPKMNGPMVNAIQKWVKRNARASRREDQKYNTSGLQRKRKSVSDLNTGRTTAYLIARKIKQQGLKRTGFFDDAVSEYFGDLFTQTIAKAMVADIAVVIKSKNLLINKENK